jgi:iron complex outermembrane recepter protein
MKLSIHLAVGLALASAQMAVAATAEDDSLAEVTITGTRIQQAVGMTTPTPVAALTSTEIVAMSPGSLTEAMSQLPQFYGSATAENFNTGANGFFASPGGGSLNLRGIGSKRTLTLLDSRRVVSATVYGGPDINTFPVEMMKRVEAVTGGASAQYGTDAVSGVVNFILDTDFEGFRGRAQMGTTSRGDADSAEYAVSFGHHFGEKFHVMFSAEHDEQDSVENFDGRDWYQAWGLIRNPSAAAVAPLYSQANPQLIPANYLAATNASYDGIITAWQAAPGFTVPASFTSMTFNSDGRLSPFVRGNPYSAASAAHTINQGGSGTDNNSDRYNLMPSSNRNNLFGYLDYDVSDATNVFVQGMYSKQELRAVNQVGALYPGGVGHFATIYKDNAFLTPELRASMQANNIASFTLGRIGHSSDIGGDGYVENDSKMVSATAGFKTDITSDGYFNGWTINGYGQYGQTDLDAQQQGGLRSDRIYLATDAVFQGGVNPLTGVGTGPIMCRVTQVSGNVPGCVPINLFGRGQASQAAVDWVTGMDPGVSVSVTPYLPGFPPETYSYVGDEYKHRLVKLKQTMFELSASGKLFDGWAGDINAAFGADYRKESVDQKVQAPQGNLAADPFYYPVWCNDGAVQAQCLDQIAKGYRPPGNIGIRGIQPGVMTNSVEFQFSKVPFIRGDFDVKELFAEAIVPLVKDVPFLKELSFQGAVRWADYAGSGSIWSYKGGLDAQIVDSFRLRGTYSRDVRAANIGERFDRTGGFANITDKIVPPPVPASYGITIVSGGNPELDPEKADTFTVGFVYQPGWAQGLSASIDWLSVSLTDAIESLTAQQIIDACYVNGDADQCTRIHRDTTSGKITLVDQVQQNLSKAKVSGIDGEIDYTHPITVFGGDERLTARLFVSWLDENSRTNSFGVKTDLLGSVPANLLEWKGTFMVAYGNGPFNWSAQARYLGSGILNTAYNQPSLAAATLGQTVWNVADNTIGSVVYFDTRISYDIPVGDTTVQIYANVNNLTDRDPPVVMSDFGTGLFGAPAAAYNTMYDVLGRRFTLGVSMKF